MRPTSLVRFLLLVALVSVCAPLPGCGSEEGDARPVEGGASPRAVLDRIAAALDANRYADLLPVVLPDQRAELCFGLGVAGPKGRMGMREALLPAAAAAGDQEVVRIQTQIVKMRTAHDRVLQTHGIADVDLKTVLRAGADRSLRRELATGALKDVDLYVFLRDVDRVLTTHPTGQPATMGPFKDVDYRALIIEESGETARATAPGSEKEPKKSLELVRIDGRWYADLFSIE